MPDALVTGATGFIGSALTRRLVAEGRSVRGLVRTAAGAEAVEAAGAQPVIGDLLDGPSVERAVERCRVVFHAAGLTAMCPADPTTLHRVNVDGTRSVVKASAAAGVERIVYTSSGAAIGEAAGVTATERTPHRGWYLSPYEESKHRAEVAAIAEAARQSVDLVVVNPSSVQGPGRTGGSARILIAALRGRLRFAVRTRMSLVSIVDCVEGHTAAEAYGVAGERYLLSGWSPTVEEMVAALDAAAGTITRVRYLPGWMVSPAAAALGAAFRVVRRDAPLCAAMMRTLRNGHVFDGSRAERELGVRYTPPADWLAETLEWYRDQGLV